MIQESSDNFLRLEVDDADHGQRLDKFVSEKQNDLSRSQAKNLIDTGNVLLEGTSHKKVRAKLLVETGQVWRVKKVLPTESLIVAEDLPLHVLFEDDAIIVIDKAAGMVVHPGAGHTDGTLVNGLRYRYPDIQIGSELRPGLVHRLDKETSGVMIVARTEEAHRALSLAFAEREVEKKYLAFCYGRPKQDTFSLKTGHRRHETDRRRFTTRLEPPHEEAKGIRFAHTDFMMRGSAQGVSYLDAVLHTGRTHQIRAHLADLGYPLIMDSLYGGLKPDKRIGPGPVQRAAKALQRHGLHAASIAFKHPINREKVVFEAPLPEDLKNLQHAILAANSI